MPIETIRNYFMRLRLTDRRNLMIPVIIGVLGLFILVREKVKGY